MKFTRTSNFKNLNLPVYPDNFYKKNKDWISWPNFFCR